ncbi:MAG TPA: hypothetical protein VFQ74_07585 [Pseudolysinimonas sp.]|nr:hypothetical protein [Pseudolysinimonas sp.]
MVSGLFWSIGTFVGERRDIWRDMLPQNRETTFVAQINENMRRQAEAFRARMADFTDESGFDDGL